jgi:hypothetical protein
VAALSVIFTGYSTPAVEYEVLCNKNPSFKWSLIFVAIRSDLKKEKAVVPAWKHKFSLPVHFNERVLLPKFFHFQIQSSKQCITFRIAIFFLSYIQRNTLMHLKFNPISGAVMIVYAHILKLQLAYEYDISLNIITFIKMVLYHVSTSKWLESTSFRNTSSYPTVIFRLNHTELIATSFSYIYHIWKQILIRERNNNNLWERTLWMISAFLLFQEQQHSVEVVPRNPRHYDDRNGSMEEVIRRWHLSEIFDHASGKQFNGCYFIETNRGDHMWESVLQL